MSDTTQYISAYSGEQIEHAVTLFNHTKYARRTSFQHHIYKTSDSDTDHIKWRVARDNDNNILYYFIDIKLTGIYDQGDYPMVYFLDTQSNRYEVDYRNIDNNTAKDAPTIRVMSYADIEGDVVEVANISNSPFAS